MPIILLGWNHQTSPVDLREQVSLSGPGLRLALGQLGVPASLQRSGTGRPGPTEPDSVLLREAVILSTCNRLELYALASDAARAVTGALIPVTAKL